MSSKRSFPTSINQEVVVIGIDVAKRQHVAVIRVSEGVFLKAFAFANDRSGFEKLLTRVRDAVERHGKRGQVYGLESTGHYGHALQQYLLACGHTVVGINPFHTKRAKELDDNSPEKSDRKDGRIIADLVAQGRGRRLQVLRGVFADLRRLGKLRATLVAERIRLVNRYKGLVDLVFPELTGLVGDVGRPSIRRVLAELPTAADIRCRQYRFLQRRLRRHSSGQVSERQCRQIYQAAQESIGIGEGLDAIRLEMKQVLGAIDHVCDRMREVAGVQQAVLERVPYAWRLLTIPQMAPATVATILGETGDLREYGNGNALIKMAGLNLYTVSSGTFKGRTRITKRGRSLLRHTLYLAGVRLSKRGSMVTEFHDRLAATKPGPQVAIAIARKLLRLMVALVRDDTVFEPGRLAVTAAVKSVA